MTHQEFVAAYARGEIRVRVDPERAARLLSGRMMLPLLLLPVFGLGVGLALTGHLALGLLVFLTALVFRYAVRASSPGFVLARALQDAAFYDQARSAGVLAVE
ncbi:MAG TPA: hypothetical protein VFC18_11570 [Burkholderiales bacterium]|nr:hypothetical protein [Burkholderiales bacterium]